MTVLGGLMVAVPLTSAEASGAGLTPGEVITLAGSGSSTDSTGTGTAAGVAAPRGVAVVGGAAYVSTSYAIERVDLSTSAVSYLAGSAQQPAGCFTDSPTATQVTFVGSAPMTTDGTFLYTSASCYGTTSYIRKTNITTGATSTVLTTAPANRFTDLAFGNGVIYATAGTSVYTIDPSTGVIALFGTDGNAGSLNAIAVDANGVWVTGKDPCSTCTGANRLDRFDPSTGAVTTVVSGATSSSGGPLLDAMVAVDGALYAAQGGLVREFSEADGSSLGVAGAGVDDEGYAEGIGSDAWFWRIQGLASDGTNLFVGDSVNNRLREISPGTAPPSGQQSENTETLNMQASDLYTIAGDGNFNMADGVGRSAEFNRVNGVAVVDGYAYVGDSGGIRRVNLTTANVTTFAGSSTTANNSCYTDSPVGTSATFENPRVATTDGYYLYVTEYSCGYTTGVVRRISLATGATSTVSTLPSGLQLAYLTFGPDGYLYGSGGVPGSPATRIYRIDPRTGAASLFVNDNNGTASVSAVTSDADALWVVARVSCTSSFCGRTNRIDRVDLTTGAISTVMSDPAPPNTSGLSYAPDGNDLVSAGDYLYASDSGSVRRYSKADGTYVTVAGAYSTSGSTGDRDGLGGGLGIAKGIASDGNNIYFADATYSQLRMAIPVPPPTANQGPVRFGETAAGGCQCAENNPNQTSAGDPVNTATGSDWETVHDLTIPGRGPALNLSRSYDSQFASQLGRFGYGWNDSYAMRVTVDPYDGSGALATSPAVDVTQENGSRVTFTRNSDGSYSAPTRVLETLTHNSDGTFTAVRRGHDTFTYNSGGALTQITDPNGYSTTLGYDGSGKLSTVTDPAARTLTYAYGTNGLVSSVTDSAGRSVSYGYDASNNLTSVTDPAGSVIGYGYDGQHRLTSVTDPRNHTATTVYDADGRVTSQTDYANRTTTFAYTVPTGLESGTTTVTDPRGNVTSYTYDNGELTTETRGDGSPQQATWTYTYDPDTNGTASVTDPLNHTWTYEYDAAGNQTSACDPLNHCTTSTFNTFDEPLTVTDAKSVTTTNVYDDDGNLQTSSTPDVQAGQTATTTYHYDDPSHPGDVTSVTSPRGKTTEMSYDSDGELLSRTDPAGDITSYTYTCTPTGPGCRPHIGWTYTTVSPRGNATGANPVDFTTSYTRDDDGRTLTVTDPRGKVTTSSYDPDGSLARVQDADGNLTQYSYNNDNQRTVTTRADTTTLQTGYDADGNITSQTDGATKTTGYAYDALNRLTSVTDPLNRTTTYGYDDAGRRTTLVDPANQTTTYGYDDANRLTSIAYSDGTTPNATFGYDADNRRSSMTDGSGSSSYAYDSLGRLTTATDGAGQVVGYSYDLDGDLTSLTYPNGQTVSRGFDDADRLSSVTDWNTNTTSFGYDADGNLTSTTTPNGVVEATTLNAADQITAMSDTVGTSTLATYSYGRDDNGQLTSTTPTGATGQGNETYAYSPLNQLTTDNTATNGTYSYDHADNLTDLPSGATQAFDDANQLASVTSSGRTTDLGYNTQGDRTSKTDPADTTTYDYDQANQMTTVTSALDGQLGSYQYDGDGLRTAKTIASGTLSFSWDRSSSLSVLLSDGSNSYIYGPGGLLVEQIDGSGASVYLQHDQQGSTRLLTDASGSVVGTYTYDPYGNTTSETGSASTSLRYNGQYQDDETGLYYLRARYYDPATAQFLTRDPIEQLTQQPYQYANGDPLDQVDPLGLCGHWYDVACQVSSAASTAGGALSTAAGAVGDAANAALPVVHAVANGVAVVASACAVVTSATVVGGVTCGSVALAAGGVTAATGAILYAEGRESGAGLALDVGGLGLSGVGSLAELGAAGARGISGAADTASFFGRASSELWGATANGLAFASRALAFEGFGFGLYGSLCNP